MSRDGTGAKTNPSKVCFNHSPRLITIPLKDTQDNSEVPHNQSTTTHLASQVMSDAPSIDPRRARIQPQTAPTVESVQPTEQPTEQIQTEQPEEQAVEGVVTSEESSHQMEQPQANEGGDAVAENEMEQVQSAEAEQVEQQQSVEGGEGSNAASSSLDAAIAATLAGAESGITQEPPRDSTSTPALYETDPSSAEVPKIETPTLPSASTSKPVAPKPTSSLSRVAQLTQRVEKNPLDGEAQLALLQEVESKGDLERTREVYEKFLTTFPDAVSSYKCFRDEMR